MFRGNHPARVDEKGRLKVPSEFKAALEAAGRECFELYKEFTIVRIALLIVNLVVLAYLVWLLRRQRRWQPNAGK